jgi:hypothetical protein
MRLSMLIIILIKFERILDLVRTYIWRAIESVVPNVLGRRNS